MNDLVKDFIEKARDENTTSIIVRRDKAIEIADAIEQLNAYGKVAADEIERLEGELDKTRDAAAFRREQNERMEAVVTAARKVCENHWAEDHREVHKLVLNEALTELDKANG